MAQNEELIVVEEELTSYTSESAAPAAAKAARPALTVAGCRRSSWSPQGSSGTRSRCARFRQLDHQRS